MSQKKTILLLSDHPMSTSGVGTQSRWLVHGLINTGKYSFKCFGGAMKHEDYSLNVVNKDFIIKPTDGFGDRNLLRQTLVQLRPDALMLFTDPRFFIWVWEMADEIRQICPITYWHLWDNYPWPDFNKVLYESTDLINCINWPTYQMVKERFPEKTNYIPHTVPKEIYRPLPENEVATFKKKLLGENRSDHFVVGYVSRNARRKMPSDILVSWKSFLDELEKKYGHRKATLVMHTEPLDPEGPNLYHVIETLNLQKDVVFSKDRTSFEDMSLLYNSFDTIVNRSCFAPGTKVVVKDKGYIPIEEVGIGDNVLTHLRRWKPVIDVIRNPGKTKKMLKLSIANSNPVECTDDHKILAIKRHDLPTGFLFSKSTLEDLNVSKLTPVNELQVGDYVVAMYDRLEKSTKTTFDMFELVKNETYIRASREEVSTYEAIDGRIVSKIMQPLDHGPVTIDLNVDVAYVLGNWAAVGSPHSSRIAFDKHHRDRIEKYILSVKHGLNMDCLVNERKSHVDVSVKNGSVVAKLFATLCGEYFRNKHVPSCIMSATDEIKRAYISGYLAGDGCTIKHPQYGHLTNRIRTNSHHNAFELRKLLIDLGYSPNLYEINNSYDYNKNDRWALEWTDTVDSTKVNGSCRSWNIDGVIVSCIQRIDSAPDQETVYDLTVAEDHTYMVENVTVSNCNEGFGLPTLESMMCGKPIIAIKTGGLTRQVEDIETGEQFGIGLDPEVKSLVGNQLVPYIYEDFVSHETLANAFMKMYELGPEGRKELGLKAQAHAHKDYDMEQMIKSWDETLSSTIDTWKTNKPKTWSHTEI